MVLLSFTGRAVYAACVMTEIVDAPPPLSTFPSKAACNPVTSAILCWCVEGGNTVGFPTISAHATELDKDSQAIPFHFHDLRSTVWTWLRVGFTGNTIMRGRSQSKPRYSARSCEAWWYRPTAARWRLRSLSNNHRCSRRKARSPAEHI